MLRTTNKVTRWTLLVIVVFLLLSLIGFTIRALSRRSISDNAALLGHVWFQVTPVVA